jgi:hypothetical protein
VPFSATINISDIEADAVLDHISELIRDPDDFNLSESDEIKVLELRKEYLSFLGECKFWLAPISLARNKGIDPKTVRKIEKLVFEHYALLKEKYNDIHRS